MWKTWQVLDTPFLFDGAVALGDMLDIEAGDAFSLNFARFPSFIFLLVHSGRSRYRPWGDVAAIYHRPLGGWRRSKERKLTHFEVVLTFTNTLSGLVVAG